MLKGIFKHLRGIVFAAAVASAMMLMAPGAAQEADASEVVDIPVLEINEVQITGVKTPVGGESPVDEAYQTAVIPEGTGYTVEAVHWYNEDGTAVGEDGFVCNKVYYCGVVLVPESGEGTETSEVQLETPFTAACGEKWDDGEVTTAPTCLKTGIKTFTCSICESNTKTETIEKKDHVYSEKYTIDKRASASEKGSKSRHCTTKNCEAKTSVTSIPKITSQKLSTDKKYYTGSSVKPPVLTIKAGTKKLVKGTDYKVTGLTSKTKMGRYKVTITYKNAYKGTETLYFDIVPKAPKSASAKLKNASKFGEHDDVVFSWKSSKGATGYLVYYKKSTAGKWISLGTTTKTSYTKKNLSAKTKYNFKVIPYYKKSSAKTKYYDKDACAKATITTLKKGKGFFTKSGQKYYEYAKDKNGKGKNVKSTFATINKKSYYFDKNGVMMTGWMKLSGNYYYFDRSTGVQKKNCTIDYVKIKKNGKAAVTTQSKKRLELMLTAKKTMQKVTKTTDSKAQKLKKVFKWVMDHPYKRYRILHQAKSSKDWEVTFANDIFKKGNGCCVSEACAFAFLAKECGYKNVYVADDTGHAWAEIDGRVYDTLFAVAKDFDSYYNSTYKVAKLYCHSKKKI